MIMLEAFGMPLPGESLLIFSAALAGRGEMSLPTLVMCAWAGAVIGDSIGYAIGRTLGRAAVARFGVRIGVTEARFGWIEELFARYGAFTVMLARFFNVLRRLNGIVAGTLGMSWWRFLVCNAVGAALLVLALSISASRWRSSGRSSSILASTKTSKSIMDSHPKAPTNSSARCETMSWQPVSVMSRGGPDFRVARFHDLREGRRCGRK
jgi:membrane protein YqaA with SNARE-associated domain